MTSTVTAKFPSLVRSGLTSYFHPQIIIQRLISTSSVDFRARRGTVEKAKKKKVKVEVKKLDFYAKLELAKNKNQSKVADKPLDDSTLPSSVDDVYELSQYKTVVYSLEDAIQSLKEIHDPSLYNMPESYVTARIELNMQAVKKTRTIDEFSRNALIKHRFLEAADRKILVFCKDHDLQNLAVKAGATVVGGDELVNTIQKGELKLHEFRYVLAHPDMLVSIIPLRGLMRRKFPSVPAGSINADVEDMVKKFIGGIEYKAQKHEIERQFGLVETYFGKLSMPTEHLVDNFVALLKDVDSARPARDGLFVTRCFLKTPNTKEIFKIDPFVYIESGELPQGDVKAEEEKSDEVAQGENKEEDSDDERDVKVAKKS